MKEQLASLRAESGAELKGLILDLRNNPGGLLDQAVAVSDLFLSDGLIVYTEGREAGSQIEFRAQQEGTEPNYPLVVLINGGSASATRGTRSATCAAWHCLCPCSTFTTR